MFLVVCYYALVLAYAEKLFGSCLMILEHIGILDFIFLLFHDERVDLGFLRSNA